MKHAKVFCVIVIIAAMLMSCASSRVDRSIIEYQREIDRLESELKSRDRAIESSINELRAISERCSGMEGTVDELIKLFDEYQRAVERLLYCYSTKE